MTKKLIRTGILPALLFVFTLSINLTAQAQTAKSFVTVDAARYQPAVTPDSIVAGFSYQLTTTEALATQDIDSVTPGIQLPTSLNGLRVLVNNRPAELLYVGPSQINYVVPSATEVDAPATVVVTDDQGTVVAQGSLTMATSSLNLFTANQSGTGSPAALITTDGLTYTPINNGDGSTNVVPPGQYLVLFGTGIRQGSDVKAFIGGIEASVEYAGSQQWYVGLDQINIKVPTTLEGQGQVEVIVTAGNATSNAVLIDVGGNTTAPAGAPIVTALSTPEAVAGQIVTLTGTNFPTTLAEASVRLGSTYGQVVSTSATSLSFIVPYGAASSKITVRNNLGERQSVASLAITTTISGTVLNSSDEPVTGVPVSIVGTSSATVSDSAGHFILTSVPRGAVQLNFDTSSFPAALGLSDMVMSVLVTDGRDNEIGSNVYLPTGTGGFALFAAPSNNRAEADVSVIVENNGLKLEIPGAVTFPNGSASGKIGLVRLPLEGRLPAILPAGVYPSVAALITPMGTTFGANGTGYATLTFPNSDKFPVGTSLDLYSYRFNVAPSGFAKKGAAVVDSTGEKIIATGLIDLASVWFVGLPSDQAPITTVVGRLLDADDKPVSKARVFVRGRSGASDKDGKFEIKGVRAANGQDLVVEAGYITPAGVPLKANKTVKALTPGTTDAGDIKFPAAPPLTILLRPMEVKTTPGAAVDIKLTLSKPLAAATKINITKGEGVALEISPATIMLEAGKTEASFAVKGDTAGKGSVIAQLAEAAGDATPDNTRKGVALVYVLAAPPVLEAVRPTSAAPGAVFALVGTGFNPDAQKNAVFFKQGDLVVPVDPKTLKIEGAQPQAEASTTLFGIVPGLKAGDAEIFVAAARDGVISEPSNKLKFTVTKPSAPTIGNLTPASGLPGTIVALAGYGFDPEAKNNGIFFKLGDKIYAVSPELIKILTVPNAPNGTFSLQIAVPRMPTGDADVYAVVYRNGAPSEKSNLVKFKVTAPAAAKLDAIDPKEGQAGVSFTITGSGFDPEPKRNFVFFKKDGRYIQLDPASLKSDGKTMISGTVPKIVPGQYEVFVLTNLDSVPATATTLPGTASNGLMFTVLGPPAAKLESITPGEGLTGSTFTIKGSGFASEIKANFVYFKQNGNFMLVDPNSLKGDAASLSGVVPNVAAGDYEVVVITGGNGTTTSPGNTSNGLKFKVLAPPAPALETVSPTEGAPGTAFKLTGKNFPKVFAVVFKQGDKVETLYSEKLQFTDTAIYGVLPGFLPGAAEIFLQFSSAGKTNSLPFKFLTPTTTAKITSITPSEVTPGGRFKILGTDILPFYTVVFKQGANLITAPGQSLTFMAGGVEGTVPGLVPGDAEVMVGYGDEINHVLSNALPVKVLAPQPVLETITSVNGTPEGVSGASFKITGQNLTPLYTIVFKQGDKLVLLEPTKYQLVNGAIYGTIPDLPAGTTDVYLQLAPGTAPSNKLLFTVKPKV